MTDLETMPILHGAISAMTLDTLTDAMSKTLQTWLGRVDLLSTIKVIPGDIVTVGEGRGCIGVVCDLFVRSRGDFDLPPMVRSVRILVRGVARGGLGDIYDIDVHAPTLARVEDVTFDDAPVISVSQRQLEAINSALDDKGVIEYEVEYGPMSGLLVYRAMRSPMHTVCSIHDALLDTGLRNVSTRDLEDGRTAVEFATIDAPHIEGLTALCHQNAKLPLATLRSVGWRAA